MQTLSFTVNNAAHQLLVEKGDTLTKILREKLGLTGTKTGCEQGSCGACTVWIDGQPILSCLTPALKAQGKAVTTIEGIASGAVIHPLQQKFVDFGAIQCGFCTPGMIMTALSFLEENPNPTRLEIREALSGNLCRCTGYKKIIDAVESYVKGTPSPSAKDFQKAANEEFSIIGKPQPYLEAVRKVKGQALFADDIPIHNALHCRFLRSTHPHAKIISIDKSLAESLPGVQLVLTGKDIPGNFGVLPISYDETAMAIEKTRYIGEIVAAVAADTPEIALKACSLIQVKYSPLKEFIEAKASLNDVGANEQIHSHCRFNNNIQKKAELRFGDQTEGLEKASVRCKMDFDFQGINHGFTEPHAASAWWDENGLTINTCTQVPHYLHRTLARLMEVPMSRVRVIKPFLGGGFGGKSDPFPHEVIICWMARQLGRPVRTRLNREEVFLTNHGRHPTTLTMELGMDHKGNFEVLDTDILIDGGAYGSFGVVTTYYNGVLLQAPYKINNFGFRTRRVYTNKPQSGAMRGHGAVNSRFAIECIIDELAHRTKIDPCDLRLKNFLNENTLTIGQFRITSNGSRECIETVRKASGWDERVNSLPQGRGLGVACGFFISGSALPIHWNEYPQSSVHLKVDLDGRVLITSGASDIGQGSDTMLAMVVSEVLGLSIDQVFVISADTAITPIDLGSYSSRVTFMAGNAAKIAAENMRTQILKAVSDKTGDSIEELNLRDNRLFSNNRQTDMGWEEAIAIATTRIGALNSTGQYNSPKLGGDFKGAGAGLSPSYTFGSAVAEVEVDYLSGKVKVINVWGAHDCGKALNPLAVEGQLEGSWHMGLGQALSEQMEYHGGLLTNSNFLDYRIPTTLDTPDFHTSIVESHDPEGPFGAKECGEGAIHPVIPAVANAIFNATGLRITSLPITPEKILEGLRNLELEKSGSKPISLVKKKVVEIR